MRPEEKTLTATKLSEQSNDTKDKLPFINQKITARGDIEDTIRSLDLRISQQESEIKGTENSITEQETLNTQRHVELKGVENNIVSEQGEIVKKNKEMSGLGKEIQTNEGTIIALTEKKEVLQENSSYLKLSGLGDSSDSGIELQKIDAQIAALEAENAQKTAKIKELNALVLQHIEKVKTLSAKRDDYLNNIIPAVETNLANLRKLKVTQEGEKNNLITERTDNAKQVTVLDSEIEKEQKIIARMNEQISRSQSLYAANVEKEKPGRENLFEQMSGDFIGILA